MTQELNFLFKVRYIVNKWQSWNMDSEHMASVLDFYCGYNKLSQTW